MIFLGTKEKKRRKKKKKNEEEREFTEEGGCHYSPGPGQCCSGRCRLTYRSVRLPGGSPGVCVAGGLGGLWGKGPVMMLGGVW